MLCPKSCVWTELELCEGDFLFQKKFSIECKQKNCYLYKLSSRVSQRVLDRSSGVCFVICDVN